MSDAGIAEPGLWQPDRFKTSGPVGHNWTWCKKRISLIVGPYGTWKTTMGAMKCVLITGQQYPSMIDGVRKAKILAIRQNYRVMSDALIPSVKEFFGNAGSWPQDQKDGPCRYEMEWTAPNRLSGEVEKYHLTIDFRAFLEQSMEAFMRGKQYTACWVNEWDELPKGSLGELNSRMDRAHRSERTKEMLENPLPYNRVFGDCNMPDLDNWAHDDVIGRNTDDRHCYIQPSAYSHDREGIHRQENNYRDNMARQWEDEGVRWKIRRFLENKAGYSIHGAPVYTDFDQDRHVSSVPLVPQKNIRLVIGLDQGLKTAAVFTQKDSKGQVSILAENVTPPDGWRGGQDMARALVTQMAEHTYLNAFLRPGAFIIRVDSAATAKNAASSRMDKDERTFYTEFIKGWALATGWSPAPYMACLLYTSPSPRDQRGSRMPSSA